MSRECVCGGCGGVCLGGGGGGGGGVPSISVLLLHMLDTGQQLLFSL